MQSKTMTLSSKLVLHFVRFLSLQLLCINLVVNCYWYLIALVLDLSVLEAWQRWGIVYSVARASTWLGLARWA